MCESICAWMYVWMYVYVQICMCICTPVRLHVYLYKYVDTCMYIQGCPHALLVCAVLAPLYFPTYIVYSVGTSITLYFHPLWYLLLTLSLILTLSLSISVPPLHFPPTHSHASTHSLTIWLTIYLIHRLTDRLHVFPTPSVSSTPIISCTYDRKRIKVFHDFDFLSRLRFSIREELYSFKMLRKVSNLKRSTAGVFMISALHQCIKNK